MEKTVFVKNINGAAKDKNLIWFTVGRGIE